MKLSEIPARLGVPAARLADMAGVTAQALNNYTSGRKGRPSKFVGDLLNSAGLLREEVIFPDVFSHPDGENPARPAYWLSLACEALLEAEKRGFDAAPILRAIMAAGEKTLEEIPAGAEVEK